MLESEPDAELGYEKYEKTKDEKTNYRNGYDYAEYDQESIQSYELIDNYENLSQEKKNRIEELNKGSIGIYLRESKIIANRNIRGTRMIINR